MHATIVLLAYIHLHFLPQIGSPFALLYPCCLTGNEATVGRACLIEGRHYNSVPLFPWYDAPQSMRQPGRQKTRHRGEGDGSQPSAAASPPLRPFVCVGGSPSQQQK